MTVTVSGRLIQQNADLSDLLRQTLSYVDGGPEWLAWAMPTPMARYDLPDETTLLSEVQQGLHASPMTLLPGLGLWVSPVKLMSLGASNLRALGQAEIGDTSVAVKQQTQRIMVEHQLVDWQQLGTATDFLHDLGVQAAPVFQALDFNDRLALREVASLPLGQDGDAPAQLRLEAASFAVHQARTVPEFCDYYQVYLALAQKMNTSDGGAGERLALAQQALDTLLPLAFGAMDCPQLPARLPSPKEVEQSLHNWLAKGRMLGFPSLSQAVLQIVTQTAFIKETGTDARRIFELYLSTAQAFLGSRNAWDSQLGQDGTSLTFTLTSGGLTAELSTNQQAQLEVSADRVLSLRKFGARAKSEGLASMPSSSTTQNMEMSHHA